jgi:hypothetical protein
MLQLLSKAGRNSSLPLRNIFIKSTLSTATRTLATGAGNNEALKANNLFDVSNYSAIVTGGGTGIGLMITQSLVANGAKVFITDDERRRWTMSWRSITQDLERLWRE